jgi:hypothetical protein
MSAHRDSLKRGQGLFVHDLSARLARWRTYGQVTLVSALVLGAVVPCKKLDQQERSRFWTYAEAQLKLAFTEGQTVKPFVSVRVLNGQLQMRSDHIVKTYRYQQAYKKARNWAAFGGLLGFILVDSA